MRVKFLSFLYGIIFALNAFGLVSQVCKGIVIDPLTIVFFLAAFISFLIMYDLH